MKINEIVGPLKTFIATVRVGSFAAKTIVFAQSIHHARLLLTNQYYYRDVLNVTELNSQVNELEESTETLTTQQLQVKALADKAKQATAQKKQLQARQAMAKAQEKMREANKAATSA